MPVHSTCSAPIATLLLGKRSGPGGGVGSMFGGSGLMLNAMGAWPNRRDVQILSGAQNLSGRLTPTALRKKRATGAFSLRFAPWRVRIPPPPPYLLVRDLKEKSPQSGSFLNQNGGGGGIRTLVTLYRPNGFRDRRIQPLCHPSAWGKNKAGSKACFGINWRRVRDLNPGDAFDAYTISNRAPSATRTTLR